MSNLVCQLRMSDCYMPDAMTISMSLSITTEQVWQSLYLFITRLLPLPRRDCYHATMAPIYISIHSYFSLPTYRGIDQNLQSPFISVCWHIRASINNSYHRLFRYASISRHYMITLIIANSGPVIYRDIHLKANKYHISYHIRSHRVSRFDILT
jgi:hypothetical protein